MITKLLIAVLALSTVSLTALAGEGGAHTHGGGSRKGRSLRDLVDGGTCIVQLGRDFAVERAPDLPRILSALRPTHWILSILLQEEIKHLKICMIDGELAPLETSDPDSKAVSQKTDDDHLIAIREDEMVYIERAQFDLLDSISRAAFLIHEAMHSYVPRAEQGTTRRNDKVRNLVRAILENAVHPLPYEQFLLQLDYSSVSDCLPSRSIDLGIMNAYLAVFDDTHAQDPATIARAAKLIAAWNDQVSKDDDCFESLAVWDLRCTATLGNVAVWVKLEEALTDAHVQFRRRPGVDIGQACYSDRTRRALEKQKSNPHAAKSQHPAL